MALAHAFEIMNEVALDLFCKRIVRNLTDCSDGYFLGPLCINYGLVAIGFVAPVLLCGFIGLIPVELALTAGLGGALLFPLLLYRCCWSWWLMLYYSCLPNELHANRAEDCDDLSFDEEKRA